MYKRQHLSISGGGQNARYYMSLGILNQEAIFKQDKSASKHDVNVNYHKYNFRANIDANLTKTTVPVSYTHLATCVLSAFSA